MVCIQLFSETKVEDLKRQIALFMQRLEDIKPSITDPETTLLGEIEKIQHRFAEEAFNTELESFQAIKDNHILKSLNTVKGGEKVIA